MGRRRDYGAVPLQQIWVAKGPSSCLCPGYNRSASTCARRFFMRGSSYPSSSPTMWWLCSCAWPGRVCLSPRCCGVCWYRRHSPALPYLHTYTHTHTGCLRVSLVGFTPLLHSCVITRQLSTWVSYPHSVTHHVDL